MIALTDIVLLLLVAKVGGEVLGRFGISPVVSELLAGICLGPFVLDFVHPSEAFDTLAELGLLMMMLYVGLTSKFSDITKYKVSATVIGSSGVIASFALGFMATYAFGFGLVPSLFVGILLSNTSIEVVSSIIILEDTRGIGPLLVASALADDFIAIYLIGLLSAMATQGLPSLSGMLVITLKIVLFVGTLLYLSEKVLVKDIFKLLRLKYFNSDYHMLTIMFILTFSFAMLAKVVGLHEVIGAYLAGLVIGRVRERPDPMLRVQVCLNENIEHLSVYLKSIFMPFFFISIGLSFDPVKGLYWTFIAVVAAVAFIGKIAGCGIGARIMGLARERSALVGLGMCGRGSLELALVSYGFASGIIGEEIFSAVVIVSLMTIVFSPLLFRWGLSLLGPRVDQPMPIEPD